MVNPSSRRARQQQQPPADPPAGGAQGGAPDDAGDDEAGRIRTLDERFGKIEHEQAEQRGLIQQVLDRLPGRSGGQAEGEPDPAASNPPAGGPGPADIVGTVRAEIAAAETRRRAEEQQHAEQRGETERIVQEQMEKLRGEQAPRDPQTGFRGRLQRITIGKLD